MTKVLIVLFYIGGPMALTQLIYRLVDHSGNKTKILTKKFPVLVEKKFTIQIIFPMVFILVFGALGIAVNMPLKAFFITIGIVVGIINGMAITIMYND